MQCYEIAIPSIYFEVKDNKRFCSGAGELIWEPEDLGDLFGQSLFSVLYFRAGLDFDAISTLDHCDCRTVPQLKLTMDL